MGLVELLKERGLEVVESDREVVVKAKAEDVKGIVKSLLDAYDGRVTLSCITGVDWIDQSVIEVAYVFWVHPESRRCVIKISLPRDNPSVETISDLMPGATFHECEVYDLLGVRFEGNKWLRKPFLLPDNMAEGFPLRKDWKPPEEVE